MQAFEQNMQNDDTAYVSVRLCAAEHAELRAWMHTHELQQFVSFPHGVRLEYRSKGWWRLNPSKNLRGASKLRTALTILRKFSRSYKEKVTREIQRLILLQNPDLQLIAFVSDTVIGNGEYHVQDKNTKQTAPASHKVPADSQRLSQLRAHFQH